MLNVPYYFNSLKWVLPASILFGTAPSQFMSWVAWRGISAVLPRHIYEAGDDALWAFYQKLVTFFYEHYTGVQLIFYDDALEVFRKRENVLFIMNHQSTVDWTVVNMMAIRQGRLGQIRYVLKDGLRYFPLYGFYFHQHSCIYVKRGGKFKEDTTVAQLNTIKKNNTKFWMVVFPEGTRYNPESTKVIQKSQQYAKDQGLEVLHNHLTPRVKATWLCLNHLREKIDAVYDVTAVYSDTFKIGTKKRVAAPGLPEFLNFSTNELHLSIKRIEVKDLPDSEEELKTWLHNRFIIKDKLIDRYLSDDPAVCRTLGDNPQKHKFSMKYTLPVFLMYVAINIPLYGTEFGRQLTWQVAVGCTVLGCVWMKIKS